MHSIHIVEPTLMTETGHCHSFLSSLCQVAHDVRLELWISRKANIAISGSFIQVRKYFFRKIRRLQSYFLYRNLLNTSGRIFISTASLTDLLIIDWASSSPLPENKVFLYFHWLNMTERKIERLRKIAQRQPNIVIMAPTLSVTQAFCNVGFPNVRVVPYPIGKQMPSVRSDSVSFKSLLYAGAARPEKGIEHVIDLVHYMERTNEQIPCRLQISPDHNHEHNSATKAQLQRLAAVHYPFLDIFPETLPTKDYLNLFEGVICIQLYNPELFADRISGVTLDALTAGSPIVTTAGSWIARMVQRFDAGIVISETTPETVIAAIKHIVANYARFRTNALAAGHTLTKEHSAEFLFQTLTGSSE
jgi:hypothetical protein